MLASLVAVTKDHVNNSFRYTAKLPDGTVVARGGTLTREEATEIATKALVDALVERVDALEGDLGEAVAVIEGGTEVVLDATARFEELEESVAVLGASDCLAHLSECPASEIRAAFAEDEKRAERVKRRIAAAKPKR